MVGNLDGSKEVHRHGLVEVIHGVGQIIGKIVTHEACVIEHQVHLHTPAIDFCQGSINFRFVFEVTTHGTNFDTILFDFVDYRFCMRLVTALKNNVGAEFRHFDSGESANSAAATRDQGPFALNVDHKSSFIFCEGNPTLSVCRYKDKLQRYKMHHFFQEFCIQE